MEWEKVQIASETGDEREGKDVNVEVEGSNSDGHGKEKDKEGHIMKIIEGLQREAQARRADSRKLMKVRDRQGVLNLKFLKSLERIERKLEETQVRRRVAEPLGEEGDQEALGLLRGKGGRGVVADILVAPKDIPVGEHAVVRAHLLPESTENLEGMN
jgi:hypothetical protein